MKGKKSGVVGLSADDGNGEVTACRLTTAEESKGLPAGDGKPKKGIAD